MPKWVIFVGDLYDFTSSDQTSTFEKLTIQFALCWMFNKIKLTVYFKNSFSMDDKFLQLYKFITIFICRINH